MAVRDRAAAFYRRNASVIHYTAAVAQLLTVPFLLASVVGQIALFDPLRTWVVIPATAIETVTVAVLLVTGHAGPRAKAPACHWCDGVVAPVVTAYRCPKCGKIDRGEGQTKPAP